MAIIIGLLFVVRLLNLKEFLQLDLFYSEWLEIIVEFRKSVYLLLFNGCSSVTFCKRSKPFDPF